MGTLKGVIIGASVVVIAFLAFVIYASSSSNLLSNPQNRENNVLSESINLQNFVRSSEPIKTYNNCITEMLTDKGRPLQSAEVECWDEDVKWSFLNRPLGKPLAEFKFSAPTQLVDSGLLCFACESKVYQYGDNDFQLVLFDEVGEKKYDVKLWELPH